MLNQKRFCYSLGPILVKNLRNSWTQFLTNLEKYHTSSHPPREAKTATFPRVGVIR